MGFRIIYSTKGGFFVERKGFKINCLSYFCDNMGGGATWYRITLIGGQGEKGLYRLEDCFIPVGSEVPENPPYREFLALSTYVGLGDAMGKPTLDTLRPQILALSQPGTTVEHKPFPRHFSP